MTGGLNASSDDNELDQRNSDKVKMWWFSDWAHLALLYLDLLMSTGIGLIIVISLDEDKSKQIILQIFLGGTKHTNTWLWYLYVFTR